MVDYVEDWFQIIIDVNFPSKRVIADFDVAVEDTLLFLKTVNDPAFKGPLSLGQFPIPETAALYATYISELLDYIKSTKFGTMTFSPNKRPKNGAGMGVQTVELKEPKTVQFNGKLAYEVSENGDDARSLHVEMSNIYNIPTAKSFKAGTAKFKLAMPKPPAVVKEYYALYDVGANAIGEVRFGSISNGTMTTFLTLDSYDPGGVGVKDIVETYLREFFDWQGDIGAPINVTGLTAFDADNTPVTVSQNQISADGGEVPGYPKDVTMVPTGLAGNKPQGWSLAVQAQQFKNKTATTPDVSEGTATAGSGDDGETNAEVNIPLPLSAIPDPELS